MYYLETSALRSLSAKLSHIRTADSFTSALAIFEILSGIDKKNYAERGGILKSIVDSRITTDWAFPNQLMLGAFGIHDKADITSRELARVLEVVAISPSLEEAEALCLSRRTKWGVQGLSLLRAEIGAAFVSEVTRKFGEHKQEYSYKAFTQVFERYQDIPDDDIAAIEERNRLISAMTATLLKNTAIDICTKVLRTTDPKCALQLIDRYDNSLDIHFLASALSQERRIAYRQTPQKNDLADITHFAYLKNNKTIKIVTADSLILETMRSIDRRKVLTPENYLGTR
jgi:predicted nucleic acid-binding protein